MPIAPTHNAALIDRRDAARRMLAAGDPARATELLEGVADADPTGECLALHEGTLDPARHPTRAFVAELADDPWAGERARERG